MPKRSADGEQDDGALKSGHRPDQMEIDDGDDGMGEFEDEYEDEYESEDEILEAGVDGRPDAEREAEEKAGKKDLPIFPLFAAVALVGRGGREMAVLQTAKVDN